MANTMTQESEGTTDPLAKQMLLVSEVGLMPWTRAQPIRYNHSNRADTKCQVGWQYKHRKYDAECSSSAWGSRWGCPVARGQGTQGCPRNNPEFHRHIQGGHQ